MAAKTNYIDKENLYSVPLPVHAETYTVISHETICKYVHQQLDAAGFSIMNETFKANVNGEVAYGVYQLDHSNDPDLSMMFAWGNSYDKSRRFRCAIGANVTVSNNSMISGGNTNYARKHTGTADLEALQHITNQVAGAIGDYEKLIQDKDLLKNITISAKLRSEIIGRLFLENEILNLNQMGIILNEMKKPSFNYNADQDSAWTLYNHINLSLKESHPAKWMDHHQELHRFFINEYGRLIDNTKEDTDNSIPFVKPEIALAPSLLISAEKEQDVQYEQMKDALGEIFYPNLKNKPQSVVFL